MPMERERYSDNWEQIALAKKEAADWHCEDCGRPCRRPGQRWLEFANELMNLGYSFDLDKPQQWTLTVAHLNQDPSDNNPSNLRALCAPCHLKHDAPYRQANAYAKRERKGQLSLEMLATPEPAGQGKDPSRIQPPIRIKLENS